MSTHLPPNWRRRLSAVIGGAVRPNASVARFLDAWQRAEGGSARFNPMNTTLPLAGSWLYNSAGVRNYRHAIDGICATAVTLANGYYPGLLADLQSGKHSPQQMVERNRAEIRKWGTNPDTILAILKGH